MGKGLLAPISMFNRMYRSIFTSRESKLNGGWLRAKVLWEERARPGWLHQAERGEQVGSKENTVCCSRKPEEEHGTSLGVPGTQLVLSARSLLHVLPCERHGSPKPAASE